MSNVDKLKPNFLIVGAAKAGTTSLARYLNEHPDIFIPEKKELRFFVSGAISKINPKDPLLNGILKQSIFNEEDYFSRFSIDHKLNGEASVHYLYHYDEAIPKIKNRLGDIPIIISLRNPVERAISNWAFNSRDLLPFKEAFSKETERKMLNFNCFWYYKSLGLYHNQVKAYLDNFSKVKVILFENFVKHTDSHIDGILKFLNIDSYTNINTETIYNKTKNIYSDVKFVNKLLLVPEIYSTANKLYDKGIFKSLFINKKDEAKDINRNDYLDHFIDSINRINKLLPALNTRIWLKS